MSAVKCDWIRNAVLGHLAERTAVERVRDLCIVTLPLRVVDGRLVDVFVETRQADSYFVHDGGKAVNELILNGINITPTMQQRYEQIANRFGAVWANEMFQSLCKLDRLTVAIYAVGSCSALAGVDLLEEVADLREDPIHTQLGTALRSWGKRRVRIKEDFLVKGAWAQHSFDFVVSPTERRTAQPIAISIVNPGSNPITAAKNAAFRARDLEGTSANQWPKVIVQARAEAWSRPSRKLLAKCADAVIELSCGEKPSREIISRYLDPLLSAA